MDACGGACWGFCGGIAVGIGALAAACEGRAEGFRVTTTDARAWTAEAVAGFGGALSVADGSGFALVGLGVPWDDGTLSLIAR